MMSSKAHGAKAIARCSPQALRDARGRRTKWESEAGTVLTHAKDGNPSPKKIAIVDRENDWPEGVAVAADLPPSWELKDSE